MTDITVCNGTQRLAVSVQGPVGAADVLCLHGISSSRDTWEETALRLQDRFRVWTLDLRGHGHSDRASSYLIADYVADAAAVLNSIVRPAAHTGLSPGAVIAATLAPPPAPLVRAAPLHTAPRVVGGAGGGRGGGCGAARSSTSALNNAPCTPGGSPGTSAPIRSISTAANDP